MLSRLTLVAIVFCCTLSGWTNAAEPATPLAGTQPLTWEGDLAARMVDDLHKFADRETAASVERRARHWQRDFASPQAYDKSIAPNRARLAKYLGVPSTPAEPRGVQQFESFLVGGEPVTSPISRAVRWPTRDGRTGYGIHIRPSGGRTSKSAVIIVVDPHLEPVDVQRIDLPQRFAEAGLDVYVTTVVDRDFRHSVVAAGTPLAKLRRNALSAASSALSVVARATMSSSVAPCTTLSGSSTLPLVFDILSPFSSVTIDVKYTVRNGTLPMKWIPIIIMRATQKKIISGPVTSTLLG